MSVFDDKWILPFRSSDVQLTLLGGFPLGLGSNFFLSGKHFEEEKDYYPLKMKLRNGSLLTDRGFYDHFDSVFHDRSRRQDSRAGSTRSASQTSGRGKEYVIPIKIETSSGIAKGEHDVVRNPGENSTALTSSSVSASEDSSQRVRDIPVVRECTRRDKSRSPILPSKSLTMTKTSSSGFKVLTPTTDEDRNSSRKSDFSDVLILEVDTPQQGQDQSAKTDSNIEVVEIKDDDCFSQSLCRKPLRYYQNTPSVSSKQPVALKDSSKLATSSPGKLTPAKDVAEVGADVRRRPETGDNKRQQCCHPGSVGITTPPSYPIYDYLKPKLAAQDRQISYIRGDGNCFFRAISKDVYGSEDYHAECRQSICDLIQCQSDLFGQYIDDSSITAHLTDMRTPGTWATTCEIYAAATLLGREIYVLAPSPSSNTDYHWLLFSPRPLTKPAVGQSLVWRPEGGEPQPCYVTLCHTNANHYDHIVPVSARCNCQLPPPNLNGVSIMLDLTESDQEDAFRRNEG